MLKANTGTKILCLDFNINCLIKNWSKLSWIKFCKSILCASNISAALEFIHFSSKPGTVLSSRFLQGYKYVSLNLILK